MSLIDLSPENPYELFNQWYCEAAGNCPDKKSLAKLIPFVLFRMVRKLIAKIYPPISMHQPDSMVVSSVSNDGRPSSRVVLLKGWSNEGFLFYTNYESRKGQELEINPRVSALFHWGQPERQIRIEGRAEKVSYEQSSAYWQTRDRGSQASGYASPQSREVPSRQWLVEKVEAVEKEFKGKRIPCPPYWGGYQIVPERIEFWHGQANRFHDRVVYSKTKNTWKKTLLAP